MYTDIFGKKRMKIGLHMHTTVSDGVATIEEALEIYRNAGFDAVAITDHWIWHKNGEYKGMKIISGCEYNNSAGGKGNDSISGVYHILAIGCESEPDISKSELSMQNVIDEIHKKDGVVILAHPAWSLNSPDQMKNLKDIDTTEIYNTVSGVHASNRAYSGTIVDLLANDGVFYKLTAADDSHFYDGEQTVSYIMLDVSDGDTSREGINRKIKNGDFYATQGPEIHLEKDKDGNIVCTTSPVSKIWFFSNAAYNSERVTVGEGITRVVYPPRHFEKWVRAEAFDKDGRCAWSNIITLD